MHLHPVAGDLLAGGDPDLGLGGDVIEEPGQGECPAGPAAQPGSVPQPGSWITLPPFLVRHPRADHPPLDKKLPSAGRRADPQAELYTSAHSDEPKGEVAGRATRRQADPRHDPRVGLARYYHKARRRCQAPGQCRGRARSGTRRSPRRRACGVPSPGQSAPSPLEPTRRRVGPIGERLSGMAQWGNNGRRARLASEAQQAIDSGDTGRRGRPVSNLADPGSRRRSSPSSPG